jgi:hypothetical protein
MDILEAELRTACNLKDLDQLLNFHRYAVEFFLYEKLYNEDFVFTLRAYLIMQKYVDNFKNLKRDFLQDPLSPKRLSEMEELTKIKLQSTLQTQVIFYVVSGVVYVLCGVTVYYFCNFIQFLVFLLVCLAVNTIYYVKTMFVDKGKLNLVSKIFIYFNYLKKEKHYKICEGKEKYSQIGFWLAHIMINIHFTLQTDKRIIRKLETE